jgi:hypothetical protein
VRDFGQDEQPELTVDDVSSILAVAALDSEWPLPQRWQVEKIASETRLKFNAPTPVVALEATLAWEQPRSRTLVVQVLYWLVDAEWEVLTVEEARV